MKIIAKCSRDSSYRNCFLVEMTEDEITTVAQSKHTVEVGQTYDVSEAWQDLRLFRAAKEKIEKAAETLRACAQLSITASAAYVIEPEIKPEAAP